MSVGQPPRLVATAALSVAVISVVSQPVTLAQPIAPPTLIVTAPNALSSVADRVRGFDAGRLIGVMTLIGMSDAGAPIQVRLEPADSLVARETPESVAGFADSSNDVVVLFPSRIGSYPHGSVERLLYHEVAHVLVARAAGGVPVPRWFNEGLASAAERTWGLGDRSRFAWQLVVGGPVTATQLGGMFREDSGEIARAYVLADALVRDILERHGASAPARILRQMRAGGSFEQALYAITGFTVSEQMAVFWNRHAIWDRWITIVGHPFTLWGFVTFLALIAIWQHRRRRAQRRLRWDLEEQAEEQAWEEHRRNYRAH